MKASFLTKTVCFFFIAIFILLVYPVVAQDEEVTITGTVAAWEWDEENNVTAVAIATEDEDIIVGDNAVGRELLDLVDHVVKATGTIAENENEEKVITITAYEDLGMTDDEEEEEEEPEPEGNEG